ncbi:MAG: tetratricopeptide repeat protein [Bacteroidetes bacterium]|nr:tetratricopeptide repeat protein [Bacteroidota bacterium]
MHTPHSARNTTVFFLCIAVFGIVFDVNAVCSIQRSSAPGPALQISGTAFSVICSTVKHSKESGVTEPCSAADTGVMVLPTAERRGRTATISAELERADRLFDRQEYDKARRLLERLLPSRPNDAEVLWRLSNYAINDGDAVRYGSGDDVATRKYYHTAVRYAERAVQADPENANAHAFLAASYGSYAMYAGGKEKVKLANRIRDELDIALKLDPRNQVAHTIYGTWHREVADVSWVERQLANVFLGGMPDGSIGKSIYHLQKAIDIAPTVLRHHYELGKTCIAAEKKKEAAQAFRRALQCPDGWKVDPWRRTRMKEWLRDNT